MNKAQTEAPTKVTFIKDAWKSSTSAHQFNNDGINLFNPRITCSTLPLMDDATARDN